MPSADAPPPQRLPQVASGSPTAMIAACVYACLAAVAAADTPVHCLLEQMYGEWSVTMSAPLHGDFAGGPPDCAAVRVGPEAETMRLLAPNRIAWEGPDTPTGDRLGKFTMVRSAVVLGPLQIVCSTSWWRCAHLLGTHSLGWGPGTRCMTRAGKPRSSPAGTVGPASNSGAFWTGSRRTLPRWSRTVARCAPLMLPAHALCPVPHGAPRVTVHHVTRVM